MFFSVVFSGVIKRRVLGCLSSLFRLVKDVDLDVMEFDRYGKDFIKSRKLSPDSYFQMAIQLAFYRYCDIK